MSTSTTYAVKVVLDEDIRKVRLPTDIANAATTIGATFAISDPALIQIFWRDEDDDLITIKTTEDLSEAIRSGVSRLQIKVSTSTPTLGPTAATPAPVVASAPTAAPLKPVEAVAAAAADSTTTDATTTTTITANTAPPKATHHGVICDMSGMNPIQGSRYQLAGYDYDLCEAEFQKLDDATKADYVVIAHPGAAKVRYCLHPSEAAPPAEAATPAAATPAAATAEERKQPKQKQAVHHHIICDRSGMNPIKGTRYHLAGVNYDLCEAEFNKLAEDEKAKFVVIARRGDRPAPYNQEATAAAGGSKAGDAEADEAEEGGAEFEHFLKQIFGVAASAPAIQQIKVAFQDVNAEVTKKFAEHKAASAAAAAGGAQTCGPRSNGGSGCPMRGGKKVRGAWCGNRAARQHGGWRHHIATASAPLGDRLPAGPLGFRTFGPGVAQLQIALIKAGVLDESAIRMHTGKYGPRTAEAVHSLQQKYSLAGQPGVFDDKVAAVVLGMIDGTLAEPAPTPAPPAPSPASEQQHGVGVAVDVDVSAPAPTPVQDPSQQVQAQAQVDPTLDETGMAEVDGWLNASDKSPVPPAPAPPSKWQSELDVLAGMGFTDEAVLNPLLEKHSGSIIFVMTELLG